MDSEAEVLGSEQQVDLDVWEAVLDRFRAQFQTVNPPTFDDIDELVRTFPPDEQGDMLVNLVCEHLGLSWKRGCGCRVEDYLQYFGGQFVQFACLQSVPVEVLESEFFARHAEVEAADHPDVEEYLHRFAGRTDIADRLRRRCLSGGRYVLVRRQGQGGLGRVWLAYDCHLRRSVAIKEPNPAVADDARIVARLAREARLTAGLDHPNIVAVHELHDINGSLPFYVMRLVEGQTFRDRIRDYHRGSGATDRHRRRVLWNQLLQAYISVCEAVAYAHQQGVLHRDLKPDNVVLGSFGETVVLDWGLAKRLADSAPEETVPDEPLGIAGLASGGDTPTKTQTFESLAIVGTPGYMAPEQASGVTDRLSDIFELGAILYEILTGRAPYQSQPEEGVLRLLDRIKAADFPRPRQVSSRVPRPLEAVCLAAMATRPGDRYKTASAIADDVRHWLADEPVTVYPNRPYHRVARMFRRHVGASILAAVSTILLLLGLSLALNQERRIALVQAQAAAEESRQKKREAAIVSISKETLTTHRNGWSERAWKHVQDAAAVRADAELRDAAFATLSGVDATLYRRLDCAATQVVFDAEGKRLLLGQYGNAAARVWDEAKGTWQVSARLGPGPVVFAADGAPWQIIAETAWRYVVWDIAKNEVVRTLTVPFPDQDPPTTDPSIVPAMTVSPGGSLFAAAHGFTDERGAVTVWNVGDGNILRTFTIKASTLDFSPDARWLAAGDEQGHVVVWSLATGEEKARLQSDEVTVHSLAFGRDARVPDVDRLEHWLLAAGDAGGTVTIWDLGRKLPRSYCRGSARHVYDVEFSPDGVTLASCGRMLLKLWDVGSGRLLLDIEAGNTQYGLAFSPDGRQVAFASAPVHGWPAKVEVLDLSPGRGVQTFRGLYTSIGRVKFSRNSLQLAALSNDWKVGVWDCTTGQLTLVVKVPEGFFDDNADFDFSYDGRQIAFSSGRHATLWNLVSGELERSWELPPGLGDCIRFRPDGRLLSFRFETRDGTLPPASVARPDKHPRICRLRDLSSPEPTKPLAEIAEFNQHVFMIDGTQDGSAFSVVGIHQGPEGQRRSLRVFDALNGRELWEVPARALEEGMGSDPLGELLLFPRSGDPGSCDLFDFRTGRLIRNVAQCTSECGPKGRYLGQAGGIFSGETGQELVRWDANSACKHNSFSPDGKYFAWGVLDGSVFLCDIHEVLRRLSTVGLISE